MGMPLKLLYPAPFSEIVEDCSNLRRRLGPLALVFALVTTAGSRDAEATSTDNGTATSDPLVTNDGEAGTSVPTWREAKLVLTVDPTFAEQPHAVQALEGAVLAWTSACSELPEIEIVQATTTGSPATTEANMADHRIWYAPDGDSRAGKALAITLVTLNTEARLIDADIIVNGKHHFTDSSLSDDDWHAERNSYDLQNVLTHELGHWLGLGESYDNPEATMFAYVSPNETKKRDLDAEDILLVQVAYWQADNPSGKSSGCAIRGPGTGQQWPLIGCLAVALFWLRRANQRGMSQFGSRLSRLLR